MKKVFFFVTLALLLAACGGNPSRQDKQTTDKAAALQKADSPSAEDFAAMQELYEEAEDDHGWKPLCKWQYVDLDGDGINEVWMRDMAGEYGAFFALSDGYPELIGIETERFRPYTREIKDGKGYFCKSGAAGGPSYYTEIVALQGSRITDRFYLLEVYGEVENATLNGEDIDADKAKTYREALPESKELEIGEWNLLDLTDYDKRCLDFAKDYSDKILAIDVNINTTEMLDIAWELFAKHFKAEEVNIKQALVDKYWKK